ncbi:MAG: hypothetical protein JXD21_05395 [Candidatus Omnitrophica bacterium]|nr:hypothetical protein [Candidatus Omnitrophota bacterium]
MRTYAFLGIGIILGLIVCAQSPVYAQLMINKGKVTIDIQPQQTYMGSLTVQNSSDQDLAVRVYMEDFRYEAPYEGTKEFFPVGTQPDSCGEWFTFSPQEFSLPAFTSRDVSYAVKVPPSVKGGYYGVMFFETSPGRLQDVRMDLTIVQRIGCLFFLEGVDKEKRISIDNISLEEASVYGRLTNRGNITLVINGVFYILDQTGVVVDRGNIVPLYLPSGIQSEFETGFSSSIGAGTYTMVLTFDLEDGAVLVKEIDFRKDSSERITVLNIRD